MLGFGDKYKNKILRTFMIEQVSNKKSTNNKK
jgi:hypothetical protein